MIMMLLVSPTLHALPPLPLQLDHGACVHLVVLEPDCHHWEDLHDIMMIINENLIIIMMATCIPPPQCVSPQSRPACQSVKLNARHQQDAGSPRSEQCVIKWCLRPLTQTKFKSDLSSSVELEHNASLPLAIELRITETSFVVKGPDCGVGDNNEGGVD